MRITGLATGMDMDEIVKNSMKPYRIKIEKKGQDKEILEIKQKLYRDVLKDSRDFYTKYFDVTSTNSLLLSRNWSAVKFTSSNENAVTVIGSGDAKADNYTVTGTKAKAAKSVITDEIQNGDKLIINGKEFTLQGDSAKERANNLNNELKAAGINVNVKYTDFAGNTSGTNKSGLVIESNVLGKDSNFTLGGSFNPIVSNITPGIDATAATITSDSFTVEALKTAGGKIKIGDKEIELKLNDDNSEIEKLLQTKLKDSKLTATVDESGKISFKTTEVGTKVENPNISIGDEVGTFTPGIDFTYTTNTLELSKLANSKITINENLVDLTGKNTENEVVDYLNKVLKDQGIAITASVDGGQVLLTSNVIGSKSEINVKVGSSDVKLSEEGKDANITIKNSTGGVYNHKGISNTVTLDGIEFKFNGDIPSEGVTINGKQDVTSIKDNLVKFFNDYNTLVEKLNKLTMEKRNRDYSPLTADQKKELSEDDVKLWNSKVEQGQLSRDTDLSRINNSLKQAMRTLVDGTGLNLEKIGISPVKDYTGTKNGTYTIDENKLSKALSENTEAIMDMFIKSAPKDDILSAGSKYSKTGMMYRIKDVLYGETISTSATLLKKAGFEGTASSYNNEITLSIEKYEKKMKDMEKDFARREQALYTKYANLETIMNKYNSQQSYLSQQLGLS